MFDPPRQIRMRHPFQPVLAASFALIAALASPLAHAGRPLQTEDAGVLERGACEVEGVASRVSLAGEHATGQSLQLGCGVGYSSQLALAAIRARALGETATGWALGGKTELWRGAGNEPAALALAYGLAWERGGGQGLRHAASGVRAVYSRPMGPGVFHANLGYDRDEIAREGATVWNLAWEHEGYDVGGIRLAPMAEVFGAEGESAWWNLALRATVVPDKIYIDGSYGRQSGDGRPKLFTLGFKFAF